MSTTPQTPDLLKRQERNTRILSGLIAVMIVVVGILIWFVVDLNKKNDELKQHSQVTLNEKELVKQDLNNLLLEYDDLTTTNDSMNLQLEEEKDHIRDLISELETVKSNNASEINKYRNELSTLRDIMKSYVYQIDSLNQLNQQLIAENQLVKDDKERLQYEFDDIVDKNDELEIVVEQASVVKISKVTVSLLKANGKETEKARKVDKIKTSFTLLANEVAEQGTREVYLRITRPDGFVMTADGKTFEYQENIISYSDKRQVIYENQNLDVAVYYKLQNTMVKGKYKIELYMDGALIGAHQFVLEK